MKKILYTINVDWFFISHFLPVAIEARKRDYEVHIACGLTDKREYLERHGFIVHSLDISRSGTGILHELIAMIQIYKVIKSLNPEVVEFLTIKPVLYGGIVSMLLPLRKKVFYITGLGYVFIQKGFKGTIVKNIVKTLYSIALSGKNTTIITENIFDKNLIGNLKTVNTNQIKLIKGAGVDLTEYNYTHEKSSEILVVMVSRLLKDKGVFEYVEAAKIIKSRGLSVEFRLYGDSDSGNPTALSQDDLDEIQKDGYVTVNGFASDVAKIFTKANIIVLPSYREGLPKVLVEAAACGRAVVTTDVPGCRDAIIPNETGLLCHVKNAQSLAHKIEKLILDDTLRNDFGYAGRKLAENEFDINKVLQKHFEAYEEN